MKLNQVIPFGVISTSALALPLSTHAAQAFKPITSGGILQRTDDKLEGGKRSIFDKLMAAIIVDRSTGRI